MPPRRKPASANRTLENVVLALTEPQIRLVAAMAVTAGAQIIRGSVIAGHQRHRIQDLYALRAAGLVRPAGADRSPWLDRQWQLNEKGLAEAARIKRACGTDLTMPTPEPLSAQAARPPTSRSAPPVAAVPIPISEPLAENQSARLNGRNHP